MAAMAATLWSRKGKMAIFGDQSSHGKPRCQTCHEIWFLKIGRFSLLLQPHILITTLQRNDRLHSRPPTISFLPTPRQTPIQD
jgi:hypothetical protein